MSNSPPEVKDSPLELLKKLWLPVAGFIGAVTSTYNFYQLWLGDQENVTAFTAGAGLIVLVLVLIWMGFGYRNKTRDAVWPPGAKVTEKIFVYAPLYRKSSRIALIVIFIGMVVSVWSLKQHRQVLQEKLVVLIAAFEGPEEVYGLRNEIIENLNADFAGDKEIEIVIVDDVVTLTQGSEYARKLGKRRLADVVIWGWYRPTEDPNITIHIENLSPAEILDLQESNTYQPQATIAQLESFEIQRQIGSETSTLFSFLIGILRFESYDYKTAIEHFEQVLEEKDLSTFINQFDLYFSLGYSYDELHYYHIAIQNYNRAVEINPHKAAFNNRGFAYAQLGEFERAIADYSSAIEIDPQYVRAYSNRSVIYKELGQLDRAVQDLNKAIELNPDYSDAYINRGVVYVAQGLYTLALADYNRALQIDPGDATTYNNRGVMYLNQGQYARALTDFNQAIKINPQFAEPYLNSGNVYLSQKEYAKAIENYTKAIEINPRIPEAYYYRRHAYEVTGKSIEAELDSKKYEELTGEKP